MSEQHSAAIEAVRIGAGVLRGLSFRPACINLILGANGAGKTSLAGALESGEGLQLRDAGPPEMLVFGRGFVRRNLRQYDSLPGLVALREQDIALLEQIEALRGQRESCEHQIGEAKARCETFKQQLAADLEELQNTVFRRTARMREQFPAAFADVPDAKRLTKLLLFTMPRYYHEYDLGVDYKLICVERKSYPPFAYAEDTAVLDQPEWSALLARPIVSRADSGFAQLLQRLGDAEWVRRGHADYAHSADGLCPYCGQRLPEGFEETLADCYDAQYAADCDALGKLENDYRAAAKAVYGRLRAQLKNRFPDTEYGLYLEHLRALKETVQENLRRIAQKRSAPAIPAVLTPAEPILTKLNADIERINGAIADNERMLRDHDRMQKEIILRIREAAAFRLREQIGYYQSSAAQTSFQTQIAAEQIEALRQEIGAIDRQTAVLTKQFAASSAAVSQINAQLTEAGMQDFTLRPDTARCAYQVVRPDGSIAAALSEGEQQLLAFLYFVQLVQSRVEAGKAVAAVLDDPLTGLDPRAERLVTKLTGAMLLQCIETNRGGGKTGLLMLFVMSCQPELLRALMQEYPVPAEYRSLLTMRRKNGRTELRAYSAGQGDIIS